MPTGHTESLRKSTNKPLESKKDQSTAKVLSIHHCCVLVKTTGCHWIIYYVLRTHTFYKGCGNAKGFFV